MSDEVFLARQPIVDADRHTFGYELLYRGGPNRTSGVLDPDEATRTVMERILLQWGMEHVIGERFGFINADVSLIASGLHRAMPAEGIIFEIRELEPFDETTIGLVQRAKYDGYHVALDNVARLADLERSGLLSLASIVKIELTSALDAEIPRLIEVARQRSPGVQVIAEKVETVTDFKKCIEFGFDLFQGYYFAEPELLRRPARPVGTTTAAALRDELQRSDTTIDLDRTEEIVSRDPALAFRLLTLVNANAFGLDRSVDSLRDAIGTLRLGELRGLADLLSRSDEPGPDRDLLRRGAIRALMAYEMHADSELADAASTAGLLSIIDLVYETPLRELVDELPLTSRIADALTRGTGVLGTTLEIIRTCERDDVAALDGLAPGHIQELRALYREAVEWADTHNGEPAAASIDPT